MTHEITHCGFPFHRRDDWRGDLETRFDGPIPDALTRTEGDLWSAVRFWDRRVRYHTEALAVLAARADADLEPMKQAEARLRNDLALYHGQLDLATATLAVYLAEHGGSPCNSDAERKPDTPQDTPQDTGTTISSSMESESAAPPEPTVETPPKS